MSISSEITRLTQAKADIKNAIENKGVTVPSSVKLDDYPDYIDDIEQGGGGGGEIAKENDVIFIDYDGTILHSYTADEFLALTSMPENPTHEGLTSQGWNWTLEDAKEQVSDSGTCEIGQTYITSDGKTRIYVEMYEGRLSPYLGLNMSGTAIIDWGDGTTTQSLSGTSSATTKYLNHDYSVPGKYIITIDVNDGKAYIGGTSSGSNLFRKTTGTFSNADLVYSNCVKKVFLGKNVLLYMYAFSKMYLLETITIPNGAINSVVSAFNNCYNLLSVVYPTGSIPFGSSNLSDCIRTEYISLPYVEGDRSLSTQNFQSVKGLKRLTLPKNISLNTYAFAYCNILERIFLHGNLKSIPQACFYGCYGFKEITIPNSVTTIAQSAFANCYSLSVVVVGSGVTSISSSAFSNCYGVKEYHFLPTTPPALSNKNAFSNIQSDCVIYVPADSLEAYKTATNWDNYASKMVGE